MFVPPQHLHMEFSFENSTAEWLSFYVFFHFVHQFCISWAHLSKQLNWYQFEPQINPRHPRQSNRFELTATAYDSVWTHENETLPCRHGHTFPLFLKLVRLRMCGFNTSVLSFLSFVGMHHQQGKAQPIDSTSLIDEHKRTTSISRKNNKSPSQGTG